MQVTAHRRAAGTGSLPLCSCVWWLQRREKRRLHTHTQRNTHVCVRTCMQKYIDMYIQMNICISTNSRVSARMYTYIHRSQMSSTTVDGNVEL